MSGSPLMRIDEEHWLTIMRHLSARDQGRCACVSKLFHLLCFELYGETPFFLSSTLVDKRHESSSEMNALEAAAADLSPRLPAPPTFGLLFPTAQAFISKQERIAAAEKVARANPPNMHMIGAEVDVLLGTQGSNAAVVDRNPNRSQGAALTLGAFPEASVSSFVISVTPHDHDSTVGEAIKKSLAAQGALKKGWRVIVLITCGSAFTYVRGLVGLLQRAHPHAAILGGFTNCRAPCWAMRAYKQKVEWISNGVVGLMFRGNVPLMGLVCKEDAKSRLEEARMDMAQKNQTLLGALLFTCDAERSLPIRDADIRSFASIFPGSSLATMACGGEIGPHWETAKQGQVDGAVELHGFSAVYGLFSVPAHTLISRAARARYRPVEAAFREHRRRPETLAAMDAASAASSLPTSNSQLDEVEDEEFHFEEEKYNAFVSLSWGRPIDDNDLGTGYDGSVDGDASDGEP